MPNQNNVKEHTLMATASFGWLSSCARENVIFTGVVSSNDDTPGCTKEACNFRDANHLMQKRGIVVLGVSADDVRSHQKFANKYGLSFPLLADTDTTVSQLYGVYGEKNMLGKKYMGVKRETFLIDKDGVVRKIWHKVRPEEHAAEVLETVDALNL
jgi:peroxiredoxin Q/BCP